MAEIILFPIRPDARVPAERRAASPERALRPGSAQRSGAAPGGDRRTAEPLWREALGEELRHRRGVRGDRLVDVAGRSGVSPQYLSEVERGRKEPSSEMISAIAGALGTSVSDLARGAAYRMSGEAVLLAA